MFGNESSAHFKCEFSGRADCQDMHAALDVQLNELIADCGRRQDAEVREKQRKVFCTTGGGFVLKKRKNHTSGPDREREGTERTWVCVVA